MRRRVSDRSPIGVRDRCPHKCVRPWHEDLMTAYREHQSGRRVFPSLSEYPPALLLQIAILRQEEEAAARP